MITVDPGHHAAPSGGLFDAADCFVCQQQITNEDTRAAVFKILADKLSEPYHLQNLTAARRSWRTFFPLAQIFIVAIVQPKTYEVLGFICDKCLDTHLDQVREIYKDQPGFQP